MSNKTPVVNDTRSQFSGLSGGFKAPRKELRTGSPVSECSDCGEYFTSPSSFDKHLIRNEANPNIAPACMTPAQMREAGLSRNVNDVWTTGTGK